VRFFACAAVAPILEREREGEALGVFYFNLPTCLNYKFLATQTMWYVDVLYYQSKPP